VEQIRQEMSEFERRVQEIKDEAQESIWFEAVSALAIGLVPRAIASFKKTHPHVKINFNVARQEQILSSTKKRIIDFGLIHFPSDEPHPDMPPLRTSELVCIIPRGHPLAAKDLVTPADLQNYPLVSYRSSLPYTKLIESAFNEYGAEYKTDITVNHSVALYSTVNAGYGAAVVDNFFPLGDVFPNVIRRPFMPARRVTAAFVIAEDKPLSESAARFIEVLRTEGESLQP
jgi:DNA-binding transcriptional LysR family regulator